MEQLSTLLAKMISWIDTIINAVTGWFGFYSNGYSKLLVYGLLIFLLSKMLKVKVDVKTGS